MNDHSAEIARLHNVFFQQPVSLFNDLLWYFRYLVGFFERENHLVLF